MTSLELDYARRLQKAADEAAKKSNRHIQLVERHIAQHPASDELTTLINRVSNYPNLEQRAVFMSIVGRASDTDAREMYWVLATKGEELLGGWQATSLYLTNRGEIAVDEGYSVDGRFPSPSVEKAKDTGFIASVFGVDDLKRAAAALEMFDSWLVRTNDELNDLWREEHPSRFVRMLTALSQK